MYASNLLSRRFIYAAVFALTVVLSCSHGGAPEYEDNSPLDLSASVSAPDLGIPDGGMVTTTECDSPCWLHPLPQGNFLEDVWYDSSGNGWAVGGNSLIRIEGDKLKLVRHPAWQRQTFLERIWGSGPSDVWVVGTTVLHFDGTTWTEFPEYISKGIQDVWGTGPKDVWMVGISGQILHYDGSAWKQSPSGITSTITRISGITGTDIWVGGQYGQLLHWNGTAWSKATSPTTDDIGSLSCSSSGDCWILPYLYNQISGNTLYRLEGGRWNKHGSTPTAIALYSVRAVSATEVWLAGSTTFRFDGTSWLNTTKSLTHYLMQSVAAHGGSGGKDPIGVGIYGLIARWDGSTWRTLASGDGEHLQAAWTSPQGDIFIVGSRGGIARLRNGRLEWIGISGDSSNYRSVWGTSSSNVWAVGEYGRIVHFDGTTWSQVRDLMGGSAETLQTIAGSSAVDIWVIGDKGGLFHYDGSRFTPATSNPGISALSSLWVSSASDAWVGGSSGALGHWDGSTWTRWPMALASGNVAALWGSSASDVWAAGGFKFSGADAFLYRFNGRTWEKQIMPMGLSRPQALWGSGPLDIWLTSSYGELLRWNGATWQSVPLGTNSAIIGITGLGKSVYPVGEYGLIMQVDK